VLFLGVERLDLLVQIGNFQLCCSKQKRKGILIHAQPLQQQSNRSNRRNMAAPLDAGQGGLAAKAAAQIFLIDVLFFPQLTDAVPDVVSLHLSALLFDLLLLPIISSLSFFDYPFSSGQTQTEG